MVGFAEPRIIRGGCTPSTIWVPICGQSKRNFVLLSLEHNSPTCGFLHHTAPNQGGLTFHEFCPIGFSFLHQSFLSCLFTCGYVESETHLVLPFTYFNRFTAFRRSFLRTFPRIVAPCFRFRVGILAYFCRLMCSFRQGGMHFTWLHQCGRNCSENGVLPKSYHMVITLCHWPWATHPPMDFRGVSPLGLIFGEYQRIAFGGAFPAINWSWLGYRHAFSIEANSRRAYSRKSKALSNRALGSSNFHRLSSSDSGR